MKVADKDQKIRDRIIFAFNVIPRAIEVDRNTVYVSITEKDVNRTKLDIEAVEKDLSTLIDRDVKVKIIE